MATGTNAIATEGEAKSKLGYSGTVDTNKCCTKAKAVAMGADSSKLGSYKDTQLIKYSNIAKPSKSYRIKGDLSPYNSSCFIQFANASMNAGNSYDTTFEGDGSIDSSYSLYSNVPITESKYIITVLIYATIYFIVPSVAYN